MARRDGATDEERAALKEWQRERKRGKLSPEESEREVLDKIAELPDDDRKLAERIHAIVTTTAPDLVPRTWYGMPAYARDGNVVCFFQGASKFKARYATLGFSDKAKLDSGKMWPTSYAVTELTAEVEREIAALVEQAVG